MQQILESPLKYILELANFDSKRLFTHPVNTNFLCVLLSKRRGNSGGSMPRKHKEKNSS